MYQYFIENTKPDGFLISMDNYEIPYHRCFLESYSEYFRLYFQNNNNIPNIQLDYSKVCLEEILIQLYDNNLETKKFSFGFGFEILDFIKKYLNISEYLLYFWITKNLENFIFQYGWAYNNLIPELYSEIFLKNILLIIKSCEYIQEFKNYSMRDFSQENIRNILKLFRNFPRKYSNIIENITLDQLKLIFPVPTDLVCSCIFNYIKPEILKGYFAGINMENILVEITNNNPNIILEKLDLLSGYLANNYYSKSDRELLLNTNHCININIFNKIRYLSRDKNIIKILATAYLEIGDLIIIKSNKPDLETKIINIYSKKINKINKSMVIQLDYFQENTNNYTNFEDIGYLDLNFFLKLEPSRLEF